jgi:hypothetical protein
MINKTFRFKRFERTIINTCRKMEPPHPLPPPSTITDDTNLSVITQPKGKTKEEKIIRSIKWNTKEAWLYWDCGRGPNRQLDAKQCTMVTITTISGQVDIISNSSVTMYIPLLETPSIDHHGNPAW